ncbi:MAG: hypothetical protein ACI8XO_004546 [Verrucomicrobiales bacterium]|jgi:hypothetical protein
MIRILFLLIAFGSTAFALDYKRDIMPIFEDKCFKCHAKDKSKGGLRLDDPKHFYKRFAKNNVVVPGDWDGSYLFVTVSRAPGSKDSMPPKTKKGDGKSLTPEEVMKVAKWIYEGARIDGEKGEKGDKDDNPEDFVKFKDGVMITDSFDVAREEDEMPEKKQGEKPREWTNSAGQKIIATYKGIEGETVLLLLKSGKTVKYPVKKLSKDSRKLVEELKAGEGKEASS